MSDVVSFYDCSERYLITCKKSFLGYGIGLSEAECRPNALKCSYDMYTLNEEGLVSFLHNPSGPAILDCKTEVGEYFLNGEPMDKSVIDKLINSAKFDDKVESLLYGE